MIPVWTLDTVGWNFLTNLACSSVNLILVFLSGASVPPDASGVLFVVYLFIQDLQDIVRVIVVLLSVALPFIFWFWQILILPRCRDQLVTWLENPNKGVSEGLSAEFLRDRTWWGKGKSNTQHYLSQEAPRWHFKCFLKELEWVNRMSHLNGTLDWSEPRLVWA